MISEEKIIEWQHIYYNKLKSTLNENIFNKILCITLKKLNNIENNTKKVLKDDEDIEKIMIEETGRHFKNYFSTPHPDEYITWRWIEEEND